jgi:protein-S-isoprenylcysteine O-methyltransferase Ste14
MKNLSIFDIVFICNFLLGAIIRYPYEKNNKKLRRAGFKRGARETIALASMLTGGATLPFIYLVSPWLSFANYTVNVWIGLVGIALVFPASWLFWRSHKDLGRQFSPTLEIQDSHQLIRSGVYKKIRHPMYTALLLYAFCQLFLIGNWVVAPAYLIGFLCFYFLRIENEERLMLENFGADYSSYVKRTNRLVPGFSDVV